MLTPIEIQSKNFKTGFGYDRKEIETFRKDVLLAYEKVYKENVELRDKLKVVNEGLQYYKSIEKTLQKALVLAEKTAEETKQIAIQKAEIIEKEAHSHAASIIAEAKNELNEIQSMINQLGNQYESYKIQYKQLASAQLELLNSPTFDLASLHTNTQECATSKNHVEQFKATNIEAVKNEPIITSDTDYGKSDTIKPLDLGPVSINSYFTKRKDEEKIKEDLAAMSQELDHQFSDSDEENNHDGLNTADLNIDEINADDLNIDEIILPNEETVEETEEQTYEDDDIFSGKDLEFEFVDFDVNLD